MKLNLDLGCGMRKGISGPTDTWIGIDVRPYKGVDYVLDAGKDPYPLKDNSVDFIRSIHLFEHFNSDEFFHAMEECWRILKPDGTLHVEVPRAGTRAFYIHPDHKLQFTEDTFGFFQVPDNEGHIDSHGYLKGFWYVDVEPNPNPEAVHVNMNPNKKGATHHPFVKVTRYEDQK